MPNLNEVAPSMLAHSLVFGSTYAQNEGSRFPMTYSSSVIDFRLLRGKASKNAPLCCAARSSKEASNSRSNVLTKASSSGCEIMYPIVPGAGGVVTTFLVLAAALPPPWLQLPGEPVRSKSGAALLDKVAAERVIVG